MCKIRILVVEPHIRFYTQQNMPQGIYFQPNQQCVRGFQKGSYQPRQQFTFTQGSQIIAPKETQESKIESMMYQFIQEQR